MRLFAALLALLAVAVSRAAAFDYDHPVFQAYRREMRRARPQSPDMPFVNEAAIIQAAWDADKANGDENAVLRRERDAAASLQRSVAAASEGDDAERLNNFGYMHRVGSGLVRKMLADERWGAYFVRSQCALLSQLCGRTAAAVQEEEDLATLLGMADTSPVMAAYAKFFAREHNAVSSNGKLWSHEALELDVYLTDGALEKEWQTTTAAVRAGELTDKEATAKMANYVVGVVDTLLIDHGTTMRLAQELFRNCDVTHGKTGVNFYQWSRAFSAALAFGADTGASAASAALEKPWEEGLQLYYTEFESDPTIVLDLKCRVEPFGVLGFLVYEINRRGFVVEGVGGFYDGTTVRFDDMFQAAKFAHTQRVPTWLQFRFSADDLSQGGRGGFFASGNPNLFVGTASLLKSTNERGDGMQIDEAAVEKLRGFRAQGYDIGVWSIERELCVGALKLIGEFVDAHTDLFNRGLNLGASIFYADFPNQCESTLPSDEAGFGGPRSMKMDGISIATMRQQTNVDSKTYGFLRTPYYDAQFPPKITAVPGQTPVRRASETKPGLMDRVKGFLGSWRK